MPINREKNSARRRNSSSVEGGAVAPVVKFELPIPESTGSSLGKMENLKNEIFSEQPSSSTQAPQRTWPDLIAELKNEPGNEIMAVYSIATIPFWHELSTSLITLLPPLVTGTFFNFILFSCRWLKNRKRR